MDSGSSCAFLTQKFSILVGFLDHWILDEGIVGPIVCVLGADGLVSYRIRKVELNPRK